MMKTAIKKHILTCFLTLSVITAFAQTMTKDQQKIVSDFIDCIKLQQKEKLATQVSFPLRRDYPIPQIKNTKEFLARYNEVFDDKLTQMIVGSNPDKDWSAVGWRGIMLLNGDVWLDTDGKLIAVNYQSKFEENKKAELIKLEKSTLHESIKAFKNPILVLETAKFRIRIDELADGNYRYASWPLKNKMSDKPDIVIAKGEFVPDGSGGNHSYQFKNGVYTYECAVIVMGEKSAPPASLTVYKNEKEILYQDAKIIIK